MAIADDRAKAVELALSQIEKQFGKGVDCAPRVKGSAAADCRYLHWIH